MEIMKKIKHVKKKIACECGEEILLVPDAKAMGKLIEEHVDLHLHGLRVPVCTAANADRLRDNLNAQVLSIASQSDDEET